MYSQRAADRRPAALSPLKESAVALGALPGYAQRKCAPSRRASSRFGPFPGAPGGAELPQGRRRRAWAPSRGRPAALALVLAL
eukprot:3872766-Pyramimonas_sp.AAC.1